MAQLLVVWSVSVASAAVYCFGYKIMWSMLYTVAEAMTIVIGG